MIQVKYIMLFATFGILLTSVVLRSLARRRFLFLLVAMCFLLGLFFGVLLALCMGEANVPFLLK